MKENDGINDNKEICCISYLVAAKKRDLLI